MRYLPCLKIVSLLFLIGVAVYQQPSVFAVLPQSEVSALAHLCSREAQKVSGTWMPTTADIKDLESRISKVSNLTSIGGIIGARISEPKTYYRQYLGIYVEKRRLIYLNAFHTHTPPPQWHERFVDYCDGGPVSWGVLYDPKTHKFFGLATNGVG